MLGLGLAMWFGAPTAEAVPVAFTHEGRLTNSVGAPLVGPHDVVVGLYAGSSGGSALYTQTFDDLTFDGGYYRVQLSNVPASVFDGSTRYLELSVDGTPMAPRTSVVSVPYATRAGGVPIDATADTCTAARAGSLRWTGAALEVCDGTYEAWRGVTLAPPAINWFGSAADGAFTSTGGAGDSFASTQDGDVVVKQFSSLTINAGHTVTLANRARGLVIYVDGDAVINGKLSMTARGAKANPDDTTVTSNTPVPPSDGQAVPSTGLRFVRRTAGGTSSASSDVRGTGLALVGAEADQPPLTGDGTVFTIQKLGATGGAAFTCTGTGDNAGQNGTAGQSGGGGSGFCAHTHGGANPTAGAGGRGTAFSGGAGGGDATGPHETSSGSVWIGGNGSDYGGAGGNGVIGHPDWSSCGGAGNPAGSTSDSTPSCSGLQSGTGGLLVLIVKGNLTIGASGSIESKGSDGGPNYVSGRSGGSGGGNILVLHGGTLTNNGSISAAGGPGRGGNGSVQTAQILP
jgi:hypothetical protein